jgi:hypothetical protein
MRSWWNSNYQRAEARAGFPFEETGLTTSHIEAFTKYTESLKRPPETDSQKLLGISLSVGGLFLIAACIFIMFNIQDRYDESLQSLALTGALSCVSFFAGKSIK